MARLLQLTTGGPVGGGGGGGGAHPGRSEQRPEGGQRPGGGGWRGRGRRGDHGLQRAQLGLVGLQVAVEQLGEPLRHLCEALVGGGAAEEAGRTRLKVPYLPQSAQLVQRLPQTPAAGSGTDGRDSHTTGHHFNIKRIIEFQVD